MSLPHSGIFVHHSVEKECINDSVLVTVLTALTALKIADATSVLEEAHNIWYSYNDTSLQALRVKIKN